LFQRLWAASGKLADASELLSRAARSGIIETLVLLCKLGGDPNASQANLPTHQGSQGVVRVLLKAGAEKNAKDGKGRIPLLAAADDGRDAVAQVLLETGADARATDEDKRTALHLAASSGRDGAIEVLLKARVSANSKDKDGRTPPHLATANGQVLARIDAPSMCRRRTLMSHPCATWSYLVAGHQPSGILGPRWPGGFGRKHDRLRLSRAFGRSHLRPPKQWALAAAPRVRAEAPPAGQGPRAQTPQAPGAQYQLCHRQTHHPD
jgi:hypothetical protein